MQVLLLKGRLSQVPPKLGSVQNLIWEDYAERTISV